MYDYVIKLLRAEKATGDNYYLVVSDILGNILMSGKIDDIYKVNNDYLLNMFKLEEIKKIMSINDEKTKKCRVTVLVEVSYDKYNY